MYSITDEEEESCSTPMASRRISAASRAPLPVCRKVLFGLAAPPLQLTGNVCGFFFSLFLLEVAQLSPAMVSIISFGGRAWDAITDPLVGQMVYRTPTRFGRTRPWLLVAAPLGSFAFFSMWLYRSEMGHGVGAFAYYFVAYLLYCTFITCYHVPYTSSTILVSHIKEDKDAVTYVRIGCELIFTIIGSGLFGFVSGSKRIARNCNATLEIFNSTEFNDAVLAEQNGYMISGGLISIIFFCCGMIGAFGIKEQVMVTDRQKISLFGNIGSVMSFRPYQLLMFAFLFNSLGIQVIQSNLALFTTHSLNLAEHTYFGILNALCVSVVFVPVFGWLAGKYGKKKIYIIGLLPIVPCLAYAPFMPSGNAIVYYMLTTISGAAISVSMLMPWALLPDIIDAFYCKNDERKEATFYSLYVFFTKFAAGISLAVSQLVLSLSNYDSSTCQQPDSVGTALRMLVGPGPLVCVIIAMILICLLPIDRKKRASLEGELMSQDSPDSSPTENSTPQHQHPQLNGNLSSNSNHSSLHSPEIRRLAELDEFNSNSPTDAEDVGEESLDYDTQNGEIRSSEQLLPTKL